MKSNEIQITGKTFKDFFKAVSYVSCDCILHIDDGVLRVKTVDASNVELIDIRADSAKGLAEVFPMKQSVFFGIDVSTLLRLTKIVANSDLITMSWEKRSEVGLYKITFETNRYTTTMFSTSIESIRKEPRAPNVEETAEFSVNVSFVAQFLEIATEKCRIIVDKNVVKLSSCFDEGEMAIMRLCDGKGDATSLYSSDFLKDIVKGFPNHVAKFTLSTDRPITITLESGQIEAKWMLAPRIETD